MISRHSKIQSKSASAPAGRGGGAGHFAFQTLEKFVKMAGSATRSFSGRRGESKNTDCKTAARHEPVGCASEPEHRRAFPDMLFTRVSAIKKMVPTEKTMKLPRKFAVIEGIDWENVTETVCEGNFHPTVRGMFLDGRHFLETDQHHERIKAVDCFARGEIDDPAEYGGYWCRSRADVVRYFEILSGCYDSIKDGRYKTQAELLEESGTVDSGGVVRRIDDEIEVLIDNLGGLVFWGARANHRFSIARMLDVERLPVVLRGVDAAYAGRLGHGKNMSLRAILEECVSSHEDLEFISRGGAGQLT